MTPMKRLAPRLLLAAAIAAELAALGGCYRRVVRATGPGADAYETYEPNIGENESVWSEPKPRVIERDPMPAAKPRQASQDD